VQGKKMAEGGKERLHRLRRLYIEHPIFFVTMRIHDQRCRLDDSTMHEALREFGAVGLERGCYLGRYVLMPDHVHLFVKFQPTAEGSLVTLSRWVSALKNVCSRVWRAQGLAAPHWQKGFFDHVLRSSESYGEKWRYVEQNPVRAGLVARCADWPYQGEIYRLEY
jgi:REP element-mobilizing transposase RayT